MSTEFSQDLFLCQGLFRVSAPALYMTLAIVSSEGLKDHPETKVDGKGGGGGGQLTDNQALHLSIPGAAL